MELIAQLQGLHGRLHGFLPTWTAGVSGGILSFAFTELTTGNVALAIVFSGISSALVAYFTSRPKIISAVSQAKISESELLGRHTADLIAKLKQTADENSRIAAVQATARHRIQEFLQYAVAHINLLELVMREHGHEPPEFTRPKIAEVMRELDDKIEEIKRITDRATP